MGKYYEQLSLSERVYIQAQLELGFKAAAIATALKRNPSTVSRELWRNGWAGPARSIAFDPLVVLALPLGVGALEVFYAVFLEDPESGGDFVNQVVVVSD